MAVTIDIGEADDIHPKNKQDVGRRLAQWALAKTYGKDVVACGPLYKSMRKEGDKIVVDFDYAGGGLAARDGGKLKGFAIAGRRQEVRLGRREDRGPDGRRLQSRRSPRRRRCVTPGRTTPTATWSTRPACPPRRSARTIGTSSVADQKRPGSEHARASGKISHSRAEAQRTRHRS